MKLRSLPIILMGLSSILLQITTLRQLLSSFSGNELDIGITLSVWLIAVGIGSYTGHRLRFKNALAISFVIIALLSQPTILFTGLIKSFLPVEFGETISLLTTIIFTIISLLPICLVIGFQFPLAVAYANGDSAKAYSLEAAGAFIGGALFTLLLSGKVDVSVLSAAISIANLIMALLFFRNKFLFVLLLLPLIFYYGPDNINKTLQWKGAELISRVESRYGEIKVLKTKEQMNVYSSGKLQFSYPDPQTEELRTHLPMSVYPSAEHILVIGGSPAVLREFLKYPVSRIEFIEIDPKIIEVSFRILSKEDREIIKDKRVRIITEDARKYVKSLNTRDYDLVILNLPEPATAGINRFYTIEFFKEIRSLLNAGGIFSLNFPTSSGYISRRMQTANGSTYNSIRNVFKYTEVSSEEYGYIFASDSPVDTNPQSLGNRFSKRMIETRYFRPYVQNDAFSPLKTKMVRERLGTVNAVNSDLKPVSYLYNLMLWAEVHGGRTLNYLLELRPWHTALAAIICLLVLTAILWRKRQAVYYCMFTTGYSAMSFSMVIILTYQALYGYIYEMIGLLTAIFMIGIAAGAYAAKEIVRPLRWLQSLEVSSGIIFISAPLFFNHEIFFYILCLLCGMIGGMQFASANKYMKEEETVKIAGRLYAADLSGSVLGAFLTAIFMMPLFGVQNTLLFLVLIKGVSLILLLSIKHEKS